MTVTVLSDIDCELGEGPSYDHHTDTLWWFDIVNAKLFEKPLSSDRVIVHGLPVMASVLARIDAERQLIAAEDGLYVREVSTGRMSLHKPLEADNAVTRSNDGRVHPSGALWIGTMGRKAEREAGAIYWYRGGELRRLFNGISIPNSICFSPDGSIAYFADTARNRIMRVACEPATGLPDGEPKVYFDNRGNDGWPDGSVCDADGVVWNARWGAGQVVAHAPDGSILRSIAIGATQTSCAAFVGPKFDRLAVTTAWQDMDAKMREADPRAGFTFIVDGAEHGFNGRPEPDVVL